MRISALSCMILLPTYIIGIEATDPRINNSFEHMTLLNPLFGECTNRGLRLWIFYFVTVVITLMDHYFIHKFKKTVVDFLDSDAAKVYEVDERTIAVHSIIVKNLAQTDDDANIV
jgi:hypothetical protein